MTKVKAGLNGYWAKYIDFIRRSTNCSSVCPHRGRERRAPVWMLPKLRKTLRYMYIYMYCVSSLFYWLFLILGKFYFINSHQAHAKKKNRSAAVDTRPQWLKFFILTWHIHVAGSRLSPQSTHLSEPASDSFAGHFTILHCVYWLALIIQYGLRDALFSELDIVFPLLLLPSRFCMKQGKRSGELMRASSLTSCATGVFLSSDRVGRPLTHLFCGHQ